MYSSAPVATRDPNELTQVVRSVIKTVVWHLYQLAVLRESLLLNVDLLLALLKFPPCGYCLFPALDLFGGSGGVVARLSAQLVGVETRRLTPVLTKVLAPIVN